MFLRGRPANAGRLRRSLTIELRIQVATRSGASTRSRPALARGRQNWARPRFAAIHGMSEIRRAQLDTVSDRWRHIQVDPAYSSCKNSSSLANRSCLRFAFPRLKLHPTGHHEHLRTVLNSPERLRHRIQNGTFRYKSDVAKKRGHSPSTTFENRGTPRVPFSHTDPSSLTAPNVSLTGS